MSQTIETSKLRESISLKSLGFEITGHGYRFLMVWVFLFIASINYQNTLAYAFTLLLLSLILVSTFHTIRNLLRLQVEVARPAPVFAGQEIFFPLKVYSAGARRHETIRFSWRGYHRVTASVESNQIVTVEVPMLGQKRGVFFPGHILVYTDYPFGLFRVKSLVEISSSCLVYPKPKKNVILGYANNRPGMPGTVITEQDFSGMRPYSPGDSLKHIAWKALARNNEPLTKVFSDLNSESHIFNWQTLSALPFEDKISALADAIVAAEGCGDNYGLKLPKLEIQPNTGAEHRHHCLKALALLGTEG